MEAISLGPFLLLASFLLLSPSDQFQEQELESEETVMMTTSVCERKRKRRRRRPYTQDRM